VERLRGMGVLLAVLALTACGAKEPAASSTAVAVPATLPASVEGFLTYSEGEGDEAHDGVAETSYGSLKVGGEELLVEVESSLLKAAAIEPDGAKVRATLGSKTGEGKDAVYLVTAVSKL
jgi:hypothetical protein